MYAARLTGAAFAGPVQEYLVSVDVHPFGGQVGKIQLTAFYFEDLAAGAALEMVMVVLSRGFITVRRARELDGDKVTFFDHGLDRAVDRRDSEPAGIGLRGVKEFLGREGRRIFGKGLQDSPALLGVSFHGREYSVDAENLARSKHPMSGTSSHLVCSQAYGFRAAGKDRDRSGRQ